VLAENCPNLDTLVLKISNCTYIEGEAAKPFKQVFEKNTLKTIYLDLDRV
jgi:hypothetical protein